MNNSLRKHNFPKLLKIQNLNRQNWWNCQIAHPIKKATSSAVLMGYLYKTYEENNHKII